MIELLKLVSKDDKLLKKGDGSQPFEHQSTPQPGIGSHNHATVFVCFPILVCGFESEIRLRFYFYAHGRSVWLLYEIEGFF